VSAALARFLVEVQARDRVMLAVIEPPAILTGLDAEVAAFFAAHPTVSASEAARKLGKQKQLVLAAARRVRGSTGNRQGTGEARVERPGSRKHG